MATNSIAAQLTLLELANRSANGVLVDIAEVLNRKIRVLGDAPWFEGSELTGDRVTRRASLPTGATRGINGGVESSASQTDVVLEPYALVEDRVEIDEHEVKLAKNKQLYRYLEDIAHVHGVGRTFEGMFFNGSRAKDVRGLNGLSTRYKKLSDGNVHGCGASGSATTSAYFVKYGRDGVYLSYPSGSKTLGVEKNDEGRLLVTDAANAKKKFWAWVTQFIINGGLSIKNHDAVQRLVNIATTGSTNLFNVDLAIAAMNNIEDAYGDLDNTFLYVNKTVKTQLDIIAKDKSNVFHTAKDPFGKLQTYFYDVQIRSTASIGNDETAST